MQLMENSKPMILFFSHNANRFYYSAKQLYESTDELINRFSPEYITSSDYKFICASQRVTLLQLAALKDNKEIKKE